LINTENAYVSDLQLVVDVFYASMLPLLDDKATAVIFANIEDILLSNTVSASEMSFRAQLIVLKGFLSSLEQRQKDCRLYIDSIGDILASHMSNMGVYMVSV
jgi:actin cytoskeleton-regulatory complex protein PAN1